jgi:acetoin utilization protein AcuB
MISKRVSVSNYMTPMPYTVSPEERLDQATKLMRAFKVRHLPVVEKGHIVGIVCDRDLRFAQKLREDDPSLSETFVRDIMDQEVYAVTPQTSLSTVASHMAEHRLGAALVIQEDGHLIGIFTDLDALRALASHLHTQVPLPA